MKPGCCVGVLEDAMIERLRPPPEEAGFGALQTAKGNFPLEAMEVEGRITGLYFRTRVVQTFVNVFSEPLEATYIFPLPDRAAVREFRLKVAGRVIEGELKERGAARREYDAAIQAGHRAAIAEQERGDVFTMRAGNIPAGESVSVELELAGPLVCADGEATWRFPLVVAPRYIPGRPLSGAGVGSGVALDTDAVPDASRISPAVLIKGQPNPVRLALSVVLDPAGLPVGAMASSLHQAKVEERADGIVTIALEPGTERLDRDFILRFEVAEKGIRSGATWYRKKGADQGTLALTVVPPTLKESGTVPRDVVIVLDRSGSMEGWKMVAGRRAAGRLVDSLTGHDRFAVLLFDDRVDEFRPEPDKASALLPATDRNRYRAVEFLSGCESRGGTEMMGALNQATTFFAGASDPGRERIMVFITDGQVGNEDQLLWQVRKAAKGIRVFALGVDRAVNASFLKRLAEPTGGYCDLVESEDRLDAVMRNVYRRIGRPVLSEVSFEADGIELVAGETTPAQAPDVFPGVPAMIYVRFTGKPGKQVEIRGTTGEGKAWKQKVTLGKTDESVLEAAWAKGRVSELEHEYVTAGSRDPKLSERITRLSVEHRVLCRFTAFVAVDKAEVVNAGGKGHKVTQAVEPAQGWDMLEREVQAPAAPTSTGRKMKSAARPPMRAAPAPAPMQSLGGDDMMDLCSFDASADLGAFEEFGGLGGASPTGGFGGPPTGAPQRPPAPPPPPSPMPGPASAPSMKSGIGNSRAEATAKKDRVPTPFERFFQLFGRELRTLLDNALPEIRRAGTDADVAQAVAWLATDLRLLLERARASAGLEAAVERLARLLERFEKLPANARVRGAKTLADLIDELEKAWSELSGAPPTLPPGDPSGGSRSEFWK